MFDDDYVYEISETFINLIKGKTKEKKIDLIERSRKQEFKENEDTYNYQNLIEEVYELQIEHPEKVIKFLEIHELFYLEEEDLKILKDYYI